MSQNTPRSLLVTGGAGFIGSAFVEARVKEGHRVVVLDALTYAGHRENLANVEGEPNFTFVQGDIRDNATVTKLLADNRTNILLNFAAESHVDNSISGPGVFIDTNINGTYTLLEASRMHAMSVQDFRYVQVSTDEVFGELPAEGYFTEASPYAPNSPYSASKAAADHLVRAWGHTYNLPVVTTHCTNNYGPRQYPEKLIPHMITQALSNNTLPIYGDGMQVRDWIHVDDHSNGVWLAATKGAPGAHYCFGGHAEMTNLAMVDTICSILDTLRPRGDGSSYATLKRFVTDRLGHDRRYAIDDSKAQKELGYQPSYKFEQGLQATIQWYLQNDAWRNAVLSRKAA